MATATQTPAQVRPRREREEELLVWPDLVFVEFICAVLFTVSFTVMSALINAPLINRANPDVTPNPSKAPWYFLNLQELLLHMNPALAGVVVPTVALIVLAAVPYLDRSKEGQGVWFGTPNAVRISVFSAIFAAVLTIGLILYDSGKHAELYESITGSPWPVGQERPEWLPNSGFVEAGWDLVFSRNLRAVQTEWQWSVNAFGLDPGFGPNGENGELDWPDDFTRIPLPVINGTWWPQWGNAHGEPPPGWYQDLPDWLTGLYPYDLNVNLPAVIVEQMIPSAIMIGLPILMVYLLWRIGWVNTRRDVMLAIFSGFITVFWVMTIVGAAFRGAGQDLVAPWDVPRIDG
jgi:quinol-cytochrome oxidoreductase complex cytochrome b subunit